MKVFARNRLPVKLLADKDRERVDFHPVDTTIAQLASLPVHKDRPHDRRIEPEELKVYRVKARLVRVRHELDSDLHLRLADLEDPRRHIIAEIPAPACAVGTGHEEEYRVARAALKSIPIGSEVEVVGVAFYDFRHFAPGAAKNAIELHPVLTIRATGPPAVTVPAMSGSPRPVLTPESTTAQGNQ